jgi:Hint domain
VPPRRLDPRRSRGRDEGIYDSFTQNTTNNGTVVATFDGPNAEAAIGASGPVPVPLYAGTGRLGGREFLSRRQQSWRTTVHRPGVALTWRGKLCSHHQYRSRHLQDSGVPVTANVECFAQGTRIETTLGPVAVEDLTPDDRVITLRGGAKLLVWIGHRRVDCRRHPRLEQALPIGDRGRRVCARYAVTRSTSAMC